MWFSPARLTYVYLWLCALFNFGWAQHALNNSQMKDVHVSSRGVLFPPPVSAYIRPRRAISNVVTSSCLTPPQPVNGDYKLDRYFCDDIADCKVAEGTALEPGSQLVYRCNPGYKAKGNTDVYCRARGKWSAIPECVEVKCESLNSVSTRVSCTLYGQWVNCDSQVLPDTRAELACRHGYKKDTDFITTRRAVVNCKGNGRWDPQPIRCVPVCGVAITHQKPFVYGGVTAKIGDFPWHASLFAETNSPKAKQKIFLCGATIIQTNLVLTAAHCVYDERTKRLENPAKLFVITGNIFRDYDSPLHDAQTVRKARVKNSYTYCSYYGLIGNYASDIALLELESPFEFSSILLPACLDDSGYSDQFLEPGIFGRVAGFGRTATGTTSSVLQTITVPYISYSQCKASNNGAQNEAFISIDKFCAGYSNGSAVCEGDSGGGLVFKKGDLWYVMGIVSVGLGVNLDNGEKTCDRYSYSLYTKVPTYMMWIQDVLSYVERNELYPSCSRDTEIPTIIDATTTSTSTSTVTTPLSCSAPPQPVNGEWKLHRKYCKNDKDCSVSEGTALEPGTQLVYRCAPEFTVRGNTNVYCRATGQLSHMPTCIGDPCNLTDGSRGSCTLLRNCQPALDELKTGKSPDRQCGFAGRQPIVCCPSTMPGIAGADTEDVVVDGRGEIARQKCIEYSQLTNGTKCPASIVSDVQQENVISDTGKIKAELMEFPHMAAVGYQLDTGAIGWYCGGTLISENFVLTAAACTNSRSYGSATWVRIGELNLVKADDGAMPEDHRIKAIIRYPGYKPPLQYHNIALLRLDAPVRFSDWIKPACLHTESSIGAKEAVATGWGRLNWVGDEGSDDLMKVTLPIVDLKTCEMSWPSNVTGRRLPQGVVGAWLICAGAQGKDTCQGDSGGPLVVPSNTPNCMYDIVGITSVGRACGSNVPGLYTRVYYYVPWIESTVWGRG